MSTQRLLNAIILSERPFREYDRIICAYTQELGKMYVHAVGTKKILSKLGAHLIPMRYSRVLVVRARFLPKAIAAVSQYNFLPSMQSLHALACAGAVLRLVNDFTKEGQADEELFFLLLHALRGVNQLAIDYTEDRDYYDELMRAFFISFVSLLGYTPKMRQCFVCRKAITIQESRRIEGTLRLCCTCFLQSGIKNNTLDPNKDFYTILHAVGR